MQKRQATQITQALARVGALAQVRELLTLFPDLIDDINRLAPKRRLTSVMRAELAAAATNGDAPPPKRKAAKPVVAWRKWTPARKRKFIATMKRKRREAAQGKAAATS